MNDFMEGVDYSLYCMKCGSILRECRTMPNGSRRLINHKPNGTVCKKNQEEIVNFAKEV